MDLRKLKTLIELVESSSIAELEITEGEERVRISRIGSAQFASHVPQQSGFALPAAAAPVVSDVPAAPPQPEGHVVKSPMVGTFYRSSSPATSPRARSSWSTFPPAQRPRRSPTR